MKMKSAILWAATVIVGMPLYAAPVAINLGGNSTNDGWANLTNANYGGVGFPGSGAWTPGGAWDSYTPHGGTTAQGAIGSNTSGSADALLYKVSNGTGGGPYPAGGSMYYGGFSGDINNNGGTLGVADLSPVANLSTITFQIEIGEAWTYDFYNREFPQLTIYTEGGSITLDADYSSLFSRVYNGTVEMPTGNEDIFINTYGFQWDLSGYSDILSFEIKFTGVQHAQLYAMQLDQSDVAYSESVLPAAVPEPSTWALIGIGLTVFVVARRRTIRVS